MLGGYGSCGRPLCCTTWLQIVRADLDQDGEAAEPEPEPVEAVGHVRPAEVLPALRAAERQRREARRLRRRRRLRICRNPTGPGGAVAAAADRAAAGAAGRQSECSMSPRVGITVGDPAGIGPEIAREGGGGCRGARRLRAGALRAVDDAGAGGVRSRAASRPRPAQAAYDAIVARRRRRAGGPHRRDRDRADQQGSVRRGRPALARPHRAARASDRRAARRDDVLRRASCASSSRPSTSRSPRCRAR